MTDDCPYKAWIERSEELWRKREDMMTHRHEWHIITCADDWDTTWAIAQCDCGEQLHSSIVETRLNATSHLSAEDADWASYFMRDATNNHGMNQNFGGSVYYLTDILANYARALEGDDALPA